MMNKIIHHNKWHWGESYNIILNNGNGIVRFSIDNTDSSNGYIDGLSVVEKERNKGLGDILLNECEDLSKKLKLEKLYIFSEKNNFTFDWYKRKGFIKDKYKSKYLYRMYKKL